MAIINSDIYLIGADFCDSNLTLEEFIENDILLEFFGLNHALKASYGIFLNSCKNESISKNPVFSNGFSVFPQGFRKKFRVNLVINEQPCLEVSIGIETLFLGDQEFKSKILKFFAENRPPNWYACVMNYNKYKRVYLGDLRNLKRSLFEDINLPQCDLPEYIGFKTAEKLRNFEWELLNPQ